jgi:serine/threonine protein kinase/alpha-tubulin suppressor-like RCC1 family protein
MDDSALKVAIQSLGGDFELLRELGRGATAIVYLLRDHDLNRNVALKVIRGGLGSDDEAAGRLSREAHLVAQLQHPNIVRLYGTHRLPDGSFALLMEHVPGRNLKEVLAKEGPLPVSRVLSVLKDVASALAYAHRRRIVHRDVKPENIYIDEEVGAARLADFGVARPWDQDSRLTIPGASLGTPAYMSPEQIDGHEVDGRSDVYSLGLVGYEMIMGQHPWEGENLFTTIFKQKNQELPMGPLRLDRFPALAEALEKALKKDPQERWESAESFLKHLSSVVAVPKGDIVDRWAPRPARGGAPSSQTLVRGKPKDKNEGETLDEDLSPVDWPAFDDELEEGEVASALALLDDGILPSTEDDPGSVVGRKRGFRTILWIALATILVSGGSFGAYRLLLSPGAGSDANAASDPFVSRTPPGQRPPAPGPGSGPSASLLVMRGNNAEGTVGSRIPLVVRAATPDGTPLVDTVVLFRVDDSGAELDAEQVRTGAGGLAEASLRLPPQAGTVVVRAALPGSSNEGARIRLVAIPGPLAAATAFVGDDQTGAPGQELPEFLGVRVRDELGNLISGVEVRFRVMSGEGRIRPARTVTDDAGRAFARWTLGPVSGLQTAVAVASGVLDSLVAFQAIAGDPVRDEAPGTPEPGETTVPSDRPTLTVLRRVYSVGGSTVCRLLGGRSICRGGNDRGQWGGASVGGLQAIYAGVSHGCGLEASGEAWCWGANESGQVGDGSRADRPAAVPVATEARYSLLAAGLSHTCGLDGLGHAACWGRNLNGQLGNGSRTDQTRPAPVSGDDSYRSLVAGWNHTCGLTVRGRLRCWGLNASGQLGDGSQVDRLTPTQVSGTFQALATGAEHTCGISENALLCWGDNAAGQLGIGSAAGHHPFPQPVRGLPSPPSALAAGAVHTCALLAGGVAYCWGQNLHGQLGDGTTENSPIPVQVSGAERFVSLHAGGAVTCGFTGDGREYCWGMNQGGQLGDGTRTNRPYPVRVGGGTP